MFDLVEGCHNRWGVSVDSIITTWVETRNEQYFKVKDLVICCDPVRKCYRATGKMMNAGKTGGAVSIEYGEFPYGMERFSCYLNPGEAKAFILITDKWINGVDMGVSANRPFFLQFSDKVIEADGSNWNLGGEWRVIAMEEFMAGDSPNEIVVDDSGPGFKLVDGNLAWFQKWFLKESRYRKAQGGETSRWEPVIDGGACGDSIRGYRCISGGAGKSTATWRLTLPKAGRYRVMAKVYKETLLPGMPAGGIVCYYTVYFGEQKKEVEVNLDAELLRSYGNSCWASLGEYDFPEGEVRVTLSDREVSGRKDVAIIADAIKWVKIE